VGFIQSESNRVRKERKERETYFLFPMQEMGAKAENGGPHFLV
jgi:hypothetical protein